MSKKRYIALILFVVALGVELCVGFHMLSVNATDSGTEISTDQPCRIVEERDTEDGFTAGLEFYVPEE